MLTGLDIDHFHSEGWVLATPFTPGQVGGIRSWVTEVQSWDDNGDWLHHREMTDAGPKLCRTENFVPFHEGLRELLVSGEVAHMAAQLMDEPVNLYKEKINYKLSGGAGFRPHQDAPAYPFVDRTISVMIAIDESTLENGCLEVVSGEHSELLPMDSRGCIIDAWVKDHSWSPVEMEPGEVLFFDALTPHRSRANVSASDRRAIYPTYNVRSSGDLRDAYYAEKLRIFRDTEHNLGTVRVSLIDDFEGRVL
jgi:hypothetical protein